MADGKPRPRKCGSRGPAFEDPVLFKIPETVHVLGQAWSVGILPQWSESAIGCCDPQKRLIMIREGLDPTLTIEVFLHELLHAMLMAIGIEHDEQLVNALAPVMLDTFRRGRFIF